jgi:hypothetical protein
VTTKLFGELFDEAESGEVITSIPPGQYDMVVVGARPHNPDTSSLLFLTMNVVSGPQQGKDVDVSLYIPKPGDKAFASTMFGRKVRGFLSYPDVKAAGRAMDSAPDRDSGFAFLASALTGKLISAEIGVRQDGAWAGSNELKATKAPDAAPPFVPSAQPAQPVMQQQPMSQPAATYAQPAQQPAVQQQYVAPAVQPTGANGQSAKVPF